MTTSSPAHVLTLVFTDLVDSTALKAEHGDAAGGALIHRHRLHLQHLLEEYHGTLVDLAGDGAFSTFDTPSAAVEFALGLQVVHATERDLPAVRTGIHLGEVTRTDERVEGLAVDLAARIQSLALPGQVLMSAIVADSANQRLPDSLYGRNLHTRSHGAYQLKGSEEAFAIYEVGLEGIAPLQKPNGSAKARPVRRLVIPAALAAVAVLVGITLAWQFGWLYFLGNTSAGVATSQTPIRSLAVLPSTTSPAIPNRSTSRMA